MKEYKINFNGSVVSGKYSVPQDMGNKMYLKILGEVDSGKAVILDYVAAESVEAVVDAGTGYAKEKLTSELNALETSDFIDAVLDMVNGDNKAIAKFKTERAKIKAKIGEF